jgi:aspartate aminotransferase
VPAPQPFAEHLNLNVRGLRPSATVAINDRSNELRGEGREIWKLGLGQSPFPVPEPVVDALREHAGEKDYLPVQGLVPLREVVARQHRAACDLECDPDDVLIGPGSKELMFLLQLVYYGELVIPAPAWVSYAPQARIVGRSISYLPTFLDENWNLSARVLADHCREDPGKPRILILNYPNNPTGTSFTGDQLAELADVARRHQVILLSDEIYGKLHHENHHRSIIPLYPEGTIFSGGLSKWCGAGGWRLGLFVVPRQLRWLVRAMASVGSETFTSTSAPIQHAAIRAFEGGAEIDAYLDTSRRILRSLGRRLSEMLKDAGADLAAPDGGFYLFPDFSPFRHTLHGRGIRTGPQLCERLLDETGVAILPGSEFGRPLDEFTARLAYVDFDGSRALDLARSAPGGPADDLPPDVLRRACGRTLTAVERICDWLR